MANSKPLLPPAGRQYICDDCHNQFNDPNPAMPLLAPPQLICPKCKSTKVREINIRKGGPVEGPEKRY